MQTTATLVTVLIYAGGAAIVLGILYRLFGRSS